MAEAQTAIPPLPGFDINAISKALGGMNLGGMNLGGMNLGALSGMLNNVNLTQLLPLVPSFMKMMGGAGGLNSLFNFGGNPGVNPGFNRGLNPGYFGGGYSAAPVPAAGIAPAFVVPPHLQADPRFVVLGAIKPFLSPDKGIIIDQVMKFLVLYITISAVLPKMAIRPPVTVAAVPPVVPPVNVAASAPEAQAVTVPITTSDIPVIK